MNLPKPSSRVSVLAAVSLLMGATVATQPMPPGYIDPGPILAAAAKAIGSDSLRCVTISGTAYNYELVRENYVLTDGTWNLHLFYLHPLQHSEGMLIAYLPKERMLIEADVVNTGAPMPMTATRDQMSLFNAVKTLKLDPMTIVPVHGEPIPWTDFATIIKP